MEVPSSRPSVWETKQRLEAEHHDLPHTDISGPRFNMMEYSTRVQSLLREAGIPLQPFSITWQNLTCSVPTEPPQRAIATVLSGIKSVISTIRNGFVRLAHHGNKEDSLSRLPPSDVLHDVSGFVRPREMCLVLGSSGSGTSLLLSRIAGRRLPRLVNTSGSVLYQGEESLAGFVRPSHIVHFIGQDDTHIAPLTVRHTLEFAAACKWPAWVPHADSLRRNDILLTARLLSIERTLETIVGSDVLRGVSGGERKRVTIGEMGIGLVGGTLVMDNWSKGLDSSTTLSITQSMRKFADHLQGAVVVSMQAPGTEVFNLFDTVCLLHEGRLIYFGPKGEAEGYFSSLGFRRPPHRSVPDFLSTLSDTHHRSDYVSHIKNPNEMPPQSAEELAKSFQRSHFGEELRANIDKINCEPHHTVPPGSEFIERLGRQSTIQSPLYQVKAMMHRQKHLLLSTKRSVLQECIRNLFLGIVLGSIFWQLPNNLGGANSRDGVVFLALLFISLASLAKLRDRYEEKRVFVKQRGAAFYDAWTYLIAQAWFDFILEVVKAACLLVPLYTMGGLSLGSSAQRLLYAILVSTFLSLIMISMTRFFAALFDDPSAAQGISGLFTIIMVLFSGYMKSPSLLQKWLIWIYWANPIHYALEALLINEFDGLRFECAANELVPPLPPNADPILTSLRKCPVDPFTGMNYLKEFRGIDLDKTFRVYFFLVILGFNVLYFVLSAVATALNRPRGHGRRAPLSEVNHVQREVSVDVSQPRPDGIPGTSFTFSDMSYTVENGSKVLLSGVTGNTSGGKVVLLMGESGAGKTTLLDVCAMRKTLGRGVKVSGEIRLNGHSIDQTELAHAAGYCEQSDLHVLESTVYEAVLFSAKLRLPTSVSLKEKQLRTMETLALLDLEQYSSILVKGLGSGELKLLTMALEVVADPKVLFLDEPTSGISSSSAITVARALRKIADTGTAVICTIHQPSAEVFSLFDRLLLLKRGGKTVYFGDIGTNANIMRDYFEKHGGHEMKSDENPASWMLDVIADEKINWPEVWNTSSERQAREAENRDFASGDGTVNAAEGSEEPLKPRFNGPSLVLEMREVIKRQFWRYWRLPEYNVTRVLLNVMIAIIVGLLFLREIDDTQRGANLISAALFLTIIPANLAAQNVIPTTIEGRAVFYRETASGTYRPLAYHGAVGIVELPFTVFSTTVFALVFYFMVGLDSSRFFYFFLAIHLLYIMMVMFGIALASIFPSVAAAANVENLIFSILQVLNGFFIRKPDMRPWWKWTVWINPFSYYLSGQLQNQMKDRVFTCKDQEILISVSEDLCAQLKESTYDAATELCKFCAVPDGEAIIDRTGADSVNKWVSLIAIFVAIVLLRIVAGYGFTRKRFLSR